MLFSRVRVVLVCFFDLVHQCARSAALLRLMTEFTLVGLKFTRCQVALEICNISIPMFGKTVEVDRLESRAIFQFGSPVLRKQELKRIAVELLLIRLGLNMKGGALRYPTTLNTEYNKLYDKETWTARKSNTFSGKCRFNCKRNVQQHGF